MRMSESPPPRSVPSGVPEVAVLTGPWKLVAESVEVHSGLDAMTPRWPVMLAGPVTKTRPWWSTAMLGSLTLDDCGRVTAWNSVAVGSVCGNPTAAPGALPPPCRNAVADGHAAAGVAAR